MNVSMRQLVWRTSGAIASMILVAVLPGVALAAPCGAGLQTSDFTFRGDAASACAGPFAGNPTTVADFNVTLGGIAGIGGGWVERVSEGSYTDWNGFRFTFLAEVVPGPSRATGNFWLTITDLSPGTPPEYPVSFDLLSAPRAGNQWAGYFFDDLEFTLDETGSGSWFISFNSSNSPNEPSAGLNKMHFLLRDFVGTDCSVDCAPPTTPTGSGTEPPCARECAPATSAVPEPSTLALLALGLAGLARSSRRKRQLAALCRSPALEAGLFESVASTASRLRAAGRKRRS